MRFLKPTEATSHSFSRICCTGYGLKHQKPRDHAQITTTKLVVLGLGNPSVSLPRIGERIRPGSLAYVIHDRSYFELMLVDQSEEI